VDTREYPSGWGCNPLGKGEQTTSKKNEERHSWGERNTSTDVGLTVTQKTNYGRNKVNQSKKILKLQEILKKTKNSQERHK
jgi:hypothetical protein